MIYRRKSIKINIKNLLSSQFLPFDIQAEILNRINDVKSLMRFRSISKAWKSLIDSPKFIADHHQRAAASCRHLILVDGYDNDDDDEEEEEEFELQNSYVSIIDDNDAHSLPRDLYRLTLPSTLSLQNNNVSSIGSIGSSADGLLGYYRRCHDGTSSSIVLWNPSVGKSVVINVLRPPKGDVDIKFGFGVCPGSCDPKIVKLVTSAYDNSNIDVEVYTLSSGVWRSPLCSKLPRRSILLPYNRSVVINGIIYWLAGYKSEYPKLIFSFDLTTEEFEEIYLPDNFVTAQRLSLANRRESLVVIEYPCNIYAETQECGVWVVNHPNSFTKLYSVAVPRAITFYDIVEFRKNGDPILETRYDSYATLELYEPCSECFIDLGFRKKQYRKIWMTSYTESLLLLDHQLADSIVDQE